ncbi:hypothetical protein WL02_02105 [Burkholderia ubonensis]|uniref:hypothetical protein n=1 Tax=Burkholderia ubonensis TaxID=101571 RepID=UPI00075BB997|nr:hypothetical protein [Burkholderia ubonensis]KVC82466.1 hypothetical protein WI76_09110 [Burkholderia ubonensis]KVX12186.1 hypothetical protein WL02_02105 [Burkholderia ubonensis]
MRDFNVGGDIVAGGDVHIVDASEQPKFLVSCTTPELRAEREHRKALLSQEQWRKIKVIGLFWLVAGTCLAVSALYFYAIGNTNLASVLIGLGGLAMMAITVKVVDEPTEFEQRQLGALAEIRHILRERCAE